METNTYTFVFENESIPGIRITVHADTEEDAITSLKNHLGESANWLDIDAVCSWDVITRY